MITYILIEAEADTLVEVAEELDALQVLLGGMELEHELYRRTGSDSFQGQRTFRPREEEDVDATDAILKILSSSSNFSI